MDRGLEILKERLLAGLIRVILVLRSPLIVVPGVSEEWKTQIMQVVLATAEHEETEAAEIVDVGGEPLLEKLLSLDSGLLLRLRKA